MGETCRRVELQIDDLAHAGLLAVLKEKNGNNPESLPFATFAPPLRPSRLRAFRNPGRGGVSLRNSIFARVLYLQQQPQNS
jgi:hypothetical protein